MSALDQLIASDSGSTAQNASPLDALIAKESAPAQPASPQTYWDKWSSLVNNSPTLQGVATAPINLYLGLKQKFGGLNPAEQNVLAQNKEAETNAPVASLASNLMTMAPTAFIPGASSLTGAALVGAGNGALQPVSGDQSMSNIVTGTAKNALFGAAAGAGGSYLGARAANAFANNLADAEAQAAAQAAANSVRDGSAAAARQAGYVLPQSIVQPSFWQNRLESLGGKAAIKQEASLTNQQVTNSLARQALGMGQNDPLTLDTLDALRNNLSAPYREVAALPPRPAVQGSTVTNTPADPGFNPAQALQDLRQARNDSQGYFNAYNRSASPADLAQARQLAAQADSLESQLEQHANDSGRPDLIPQLVNARREIAKTYTVQRALNNGTGDVNPQVLGSLYNKGKPLSDGLDTIGQTAAAFPQVMRPGASVPAAGVGKTEALAAGLLGLAGQAATGGVGGLAAGTLAFTPHLARALALSNQAAPTYEASMLARMLARPSANAMTAVTQGLASYGIPQLTAQ